MIEYNPEFYLPNGIRKKKKFTVTVTRVTTETQRIEVEAISSFDAVQQVVNNGRAYDGNENYDTVNVYHDFTTAIMEE